MNKLHKIVSQMNHAITPNAPKTCQECKQTKPVAEYRKYPKGVNYDVMCLECRKVVEKKKRDDRKSNPVSPTYPMEPTPKRGRPKKIIVEDVKEVIVEDVKEDAGNADKEFRTCEVCGESKELNSDFYHRQKNGWNPSCKDCKNARRRMQYRNNEQFRKNKANYQKKYQPVYYEANKEKILLYAREYSKKAREEKRFQKLIKLEAEKLKKGVDYQNLIREEAEKLLRDEGIEILN